jgi:hypothetical protein
VSILPRPSRPFRQASVAFEVSATYAGLCLIPYAGAFFAFPGISLLTKAALKWAFNFASMLEEHQAFYWNTAIRKASQAEDVSDAQDKIDQAPKNISKEDYAKLEKARMDAFRNLVLLTE